MHKLARPATSGPDAFTTAVATIQRHADRQPYSDASAAVAACCSSFDRLAASASFHSAAAATFTVQGLNNDAMVNLYEQQFLRNQGTRTIRDSIRNAAPNGLCPYCGEGSVHELDHYLPKRPFAGTAVHPANLVPACRDCNRVKGDFSPSGSKPAVLHPYFDSAFDTHWLHASLIQLPNGQLAAGFEVRLASVNSGLQPRLESHMKVFHLYDRFRVLAGQALNNFEMLLKSPLGSTMRLASVKNHLAITSVQQSGGRANSWELALYEAMANDDWYLRTYLGLS